MWQYFGHFILLSFGFQQLLVQRGGADEERC